MRTFTIKPAHPGHEHHHMWMVIATDEDGVETTIETYNTMTEADAARAVLAREEAEAQQ
jgi:hypothetical protein